MVHFGVTPLVDIVCPTEIYRIATRCNIYLNNDYIIALLSKQP